MPRKFRSVEIRIPHQEGIHIQQTLLNSPEEKVSFALVGFATLKTRYLILVSSIVDIPDAEYVNSNHGASWSAKFNAQMIQTASKARLGLLIMHVHATHSPPRLSATDMSSGKILCAAFKAAIPELPHGSVVFNGEGAGAGIVWIPGYSEPLTISSVRWVSDPVKIEPPSVDPASNWRSRIYSRQTLLIGEQGQRLLSATRIGIVGLSGGGSHVVQQLALLGIGHLVLVDNDIMKEENLHRIVGAKPSDVKNRLPKVTVMQRLVHEINPSITAETERAKFPTDQSMNKMKECDIIVGCVDTLAARKELQTFSWRYLIPYVDIGITIRLDAMRAGMTKTVTGQVYDLIPGGGCLWCAQFLTEKGLSDESGGLGPSYVQGSRHAAQVVSFNGVLASQAVSEVLHIITDYATRTHAPCIRSILYDGIEGTMSTCVVSRKNECSVCKAQLGRGDAIW